MGNTEKENQEKTTKQKTGTSNQTEKAGQKTDAFTQTEKAGQYAECAKLKECRYCRALIPKSAKICPNCKMRLNRRWLWRLLILLLLAAACGAGVYYWIYLRPAEVRIAVNGSAGTMTEIPNDADNTEDTKNGNAGKETENADEAQTAKNETGNQLENADDEAKTADAAVDKKIEDTKEIEETDKISDIMDNLEASKPEKKEDILADAGLKAANADSDTDTGEAMDEMDKMRAAEDDIDADGQTDSQDRRKGIRGEEDGETVENTEIDIQDYTEEEFRDICQSIDYKSLLRKQDTYRNAAVKQELTVIEQVDGGLFDDNIYYLCKAEDRRGIVRYYIVRDDRKTDDMPILEGDVLMIYGQLFDSCKLSADMVKTQPLVPALTMAYYDLLDE